MDAFEIYKFLHVSAAIVWIGGGVFGAILTERAKAATHEHRLGIARDMAVVSGRVFGPAALLTLVFGILMVVTTDAITFGQTWVVVGLVAIGLSFVLGAGILGPQSARLVAALEERDETALDRLRRVALVSYADLLILLVAVWVMVTKPGL